MKPWTLRVASPDAPSVPSHSSIPAVTLTHARACLHAQPDKVQMSLSCPQPTTRLNCSREVRGVGPQTHVNKMEKLQIYSCCLRNLPPSSGRIRRTSKQPGFQLSQRDHPRDARTFL